MSPSVSARHDFEIAARKPWSHVLRKGQRLRIVDSHGQQAVDTLFYNAHDYSERYSAQDTLREQGSAYVVGGLGMTVIKRNNVVIVPIRSGIGARLGINVGYLKFTQDATWNPF